MTRHDQPIDPLIEEVRQWRRELLASCGNDLDALLRLIRQREAEHQDRVADPRDTRNPSVTNQ